MKITKFLPFVCLQTAFEYQQCIHFLGLFHHLPLKTLSGAHSQTANIQRYTKGKNFVIFISRICLLNLEENAF